MNKWLIVPLALLLFSCKSGKEEETGGSDYFPVLSFIQSQVTHVDTSLYRIIKITTVNNHSDTAYIRREDFRREAADFLSIPDITKKDLRRDYKEVELYDESMGSVILSYMPKEEDAEIRRQEVVIEPNQTDGDKVKSIFIDRLMDKDKTTVRKNMLWQVDQRFRIVTITQNEDGTEKVEKLQVIWNDNP
jgi:hypothetical protein